MEEQDIVYANLGPSPMAEMAKAVVKAAEKSNVRRLIWVATIGIYEEEPKAAIPEMRLQGGMMDDPNSYIGDEPLGADIIEASSIISTIIRPNLLTNDGQSDYVINARTDQVEVAEVSRGNVAHFISQLILQPEQYQNDSVAITNL
ncbi:NAD-dependent epimerase/dehydratase family protein [Weissella oryzae SG25]|uniref:NAD-dependent epimerase/dehydratase family protein n=2 Tax=Weissella TaxID=46255 RepID=A0A069D1L7_WEIOS|nr:NAD(P)H-binding protein [Weissella oryzae]GAK31241.1 NAD-dependent epimerase/dehydratase family protein [Weissella oryzae SG25]